MVGKEKKKKMKDERKKVLRIVGKIYPGSTQPGR